MEYQKRIDRCKFILNEISCYQAEIAYHALSVCTIRHGGKSGSLYTMTRFANDIGINKKTLSGWVSIYKNVLQKLDKEFESITKKDWQIASKVDDRIRQEIRAFNLVNGLKGKKSNSRFYNSNKIKDLFNRLYSGKDLESDLLAFNKYLIHTSNMISGKDLSNVSLSTLISIQENCNLISDRFLKQIIKGGANEKINKLSASIVY